MDGDARLRRMMADDFDFVWRSMRRIGLADAEADDATQRAFIVAAKRLSNIKQGSERSFLFGTALRIASEVKRSAARRREIAHDDFDTTDTAELPDTLLDQKRARALLDEAIERMPMDVRPVFVLIEVEQMTMADVAQLLDLPQGTVASRLRRAREIFEKKIRVFRAARARLSNAKNDGGSP